MSERFGALPLGELHAEGVCAYCGQQGEIIHWWDSLAKEIASGETSPRSRDGLRRTVHPMTLAVAHVCIDTVACERRRYNKRRRI